MRPWASSGSTGDSRHARRLLVAGAVLCIIMLVIPARMRHGDFMIEHAKSVLGNSDGIHANHAAGKESSSFESSSGRSEGNRSAVKQRSRKTAASGSGARRRSGQGLCVKALTRVLTQPQPNPCQWWTTLHERWVQEVKEADKGKGFELIFYGDSQIEMWHGLRAGLLDPVRQPLIGVFEEYFVRKWRTAAFGMSGDEAAHLMWRLQNGEIPARHQPHVAVVLVGTNDLRDAKVQRDSGPQSVKAVLSAEGAIAKAAPALARRIQASVELLREKMPQTKVLLLGLLPRHTTNKRPLPLEWPNLYTKGLAEVNKRLRKFAGKESGMLFADCSQAYVREPGQIDSRLVPDALHPSEAGARRLAACIQAAVEQAVALPIDAVQQLDSSAADPQPNKGQRAA